MWPFSNKPKAAEPEPEMRTVAVIPRSKPVRTPNQIREARRIAEADGTLPLRDCDKERLGMPLNDWPAPRPSRSPVFLVRGKDGRPKFDNDPRKLPLDVQAAFKSMMTPDEIKEYFE